MVEGGLQAMADGDWPALEAWLRQNVAEQAQFAVTGALNARGGPVINYQATLDAADIARLAQMSMTGIRAVADYGLEAEVRHVEALPNGEVGAVVVFHETGVIDPSKLPGGDAAPAGAASPATIDSTATCDLRLSGSGADLVIELATCTASTML